MGAIPMDLDDKVGLSLDEIIKASKAQEKAERVHPDRRLGPRVAGWSQPAGYSHVKARPFSNIKRRATCHLNNVYSNARNRRRIPTNSKVTVSIVNDRQPHYQRPRRGLRQPTASVNYPIKSRPHGLTRLADRLDAVHLRSCSPEDFAGGSFDEDDDQENCETASDMTKRSFRRDSRSPLQSSFARAQAERLGNSGSN
ncbi:hypothetical protein HDU89_000279 [Geranomyces variabilis]|nr:hypothetical protein HDU89_000279 [Geranomyces variabilis]